MGIGVEFKAVMVLAAITRNYSNYSYGNYPYGNYPYGNYVGNAPVVITLNTKKLKMHCLQLCQKS